MTLVKFWCVISLEYGGIKMEEFENIRDIINNAINKYPNNNAFIIKNADKKTYTNITYKHFGEDINSLETALIKNT